MCQNRANDLTGVFPAVKRRLCAAVPSSVQRRRDVGRVIYAPPSLSALRSLRL